MGESRVAAVCHLPQSGAWAAPAQGQSVAREKPDRTAGSELRVLPHPKVTFALSSHLALALALLHHHHHHHPTPCLTARPGPTRSRPRPSTRASPTRYASIGGARRIACCAEHTLTRCAFFACTRAYIATEPDQALVSLIPSEVVGVSKRTVRAGRGLNTHNLFLLLCLHLVGKSECW